MKTEKLHEVLTDRFEGTDVEITQSMCDSYLNDIDETSIRSDIESTVSDSKITGDRENELMESHNSDADTVVKIENGDSTLYEFFDESDGVASAVDARKKELIESRVNSEIISRASDMVPIPPDPDEARGVILSVAQSELGWDQAKVRSIRNDQRTNLFFDYLTEGNYEGAKTEIDYLVRETDLLDQLEGQTFKDALDGKL